MSKSGEDDERSGISTKIGEGNKRSMLRSSIESELEILFEWNVDIKLQNQQDGKQKQTLTKKRTNVAPGWYVSTPTVVGRHTIERKEIKIQSISSAPSVSVIEIDGPTNCPLRIELEVDINLLQTHLPNLIEISMPNSKRSESIGFSSDTKVRINLVRRRGKIKEKLLTLVREFKISDLEYQGITLLDFDRYLHINDFPIPQQTDELRHYISIEFDSPILPVNISGIKICKSMQVADLSSQMHDAGLLRPENDFIHLLTKCQSGKDGVRLYAVCRRHIFCKLKRIEAVDDDGEKYELIFIDEGQRANVQFYNVWLPQCLLTRNLKFFAIDIRDRATRIWTAGQQIELPSGWSFTKNHLNLRYKIDATLKEIDPDDWRCFIRNWTIEQGELRMELSLIGPLKETECIIKIFKFRDEGRMFSVQAPLRRAHRVFHLSSNLHEYYTGRYAYRCDLVIELRNAFSSSGLYSIMVKIGDGKLRGIYPYNRNYNKELKIKTALLDDKLHIVHQFSDRATRNIRLEHFAVDVAHRAEAMRLIDPAVPAPGERRQWLIGEYPTTARDNGWYLFNYICREHPNIEVKYVIDEDNRDGVMPDGETILAYGSIEHLRASRLAAACLFTHHAIYIRPNLFRAVTDQPDERPIEYFLQHGVLAIKPMLDDYHRSRQQLDLFNVSSSREKQLVMAKCSYRDHEVTVAGLPRWDALHRKAAATSSYAKLGEAKPLRILIFPTWRKGLDRLTHEEFRETRFYTAWRNAITTLREETRKVGGEVNFCMHSIFERYATEFTIDGVEPLSLKQVVDGLETYDVIVTDYSSLCFDLLYIYRPSVYFMFDKEAFFAKNRSYVDPGELPGPIATTVEELAGLLFDDKGFRHTALQEGLRKARGDYISFTDDHNSDRVIAAASARLRLAPTIG